MAVDRASLSKVVSDQIRGQILDGRLKPGERLVEDRLSLELGVSRVPVREALLGLSMEGLVRLEPRRGATVTAITPELVAELVEVRTLLEAPQAPTQMTFLQNHPLIRDLAEYGVYIQTKTYAE